MTLDELVHAIRNVSQENESLRLANNLIEWKDSSADLVDLREHVEHYLGNTWLSTNETHNSIYQLWSSFVKEQLLPVQGTSMNERLFTFGLQEQYDLATTDGKRLLYKKLLSSA